VGNYWLSNFSTNHWILWNFQMQTFLITFAVIKIWFNFNKSRIYIFIFSWHCQIFVSIAKSTKGVILSKSYPINQWPNRNRNLLCLCFFFLSHKDPNCICATELAGKRGCHGWNQLALPRCQHCGSKNLQWNHYRYRWLLFAISGKWKCYSCISILRYFPGKSKRSQMHNKLKADDLLDKL